MDKRKIKKSKANAGAEGSASTSDSSSVSCTDTVILSGEESQEERQESSDHQSKGGDSDELQEDAHVTSREQCNISDGDNESEKKRKGRHVCCL